MYSKNAPKFDLFYFIFCSDVQAKELQLQVEQIAIKEEPPYSMKESSRSGKTKSSKNKARRSPYPTVAAPEYSSSSEYSTAATATSPERQVSAPAYDYSSEMALQMQSSYPGIMYPHGTTSQEGMERYGAFYSSAYSHPGLYSDSAVGMYSSYHRYFDDRNMAAASYTRGHYEDKYYPSRDSSSGTYPGYVTSSQAAQESPRTGSDSRESYRGPATSSTGHSGDTATGTPGLTPGTSSTPQQYGDCAIQTSQCSRSSSRDTNYNQTSHSQGAGGPSYTTPYSNRSESSPSEVDVTEATDYEKRHGHAMPHRNERISSNNTNSSYTDSLMEAARVAEEKRYKENCRESTSTTNHNTLTNGDSKDSVQQQSVIMRRQSNSSSTLTDLTSRTNDQTLSKLSSALVEDTRTKSLMDSTRMNTLGSYNHCTYDASLGYKQSSYHTGYGGSRSYPMVPQAGYTSVIVDAQQYHLANGYAH